MTYVSQHQGKQLLLTCRTVLATASLDKNSTRRAPMHIGLASCTNQTTLLVLKLLDAGYAMANWELDSAGVQGSDMNAMVICPRNTHHYSRF
jgi:hypothetical protein